MSRARAALILLSFLALAGAFPAACAPEQILVATLEAGATARREPTGPRCDGDGDCGADAFCAHPTCGDREGRCELRPAFCGDAPSPVCGCDGVTYWSDCLRRSRGQSAAAAGECSLTRALACGGRGGRECPPGSTCARIAAAPTGGVGPLCPPDLPGTCWATPPVCAAPASVDRFVRCGPGGPPGPGGPGGVDGGAPCVDLCAAVRSGEPHFRALSCP